MCLTSSTYAHAGKTANRSCARRDGHPVSCSPCPYPLHRKKEGQKQKQGHRTHEKCFNRCRRQVPVCPCLQQLPPCAPFFAANFDPATSPAARLPTPFSPAPPGGSFTAMRPSSLRGGRKQPGAPANLQERREVNSSRRTAVVNNTGPCGEETCGGIPVRGGGRGWRGLHAGREGRALGEDLKQRPVGIVEGGRCDARKGTRGVGGGGSNGNPTPKGNAFFNSIGKWRRFLQHHHRR